jgi:hypothetical protein
MGELCCHAHSKEDREQSLEALREVPKSLPCRDDCMQYYLESLEEYMTRKVENK